MKRSLLASALLVSIVAVVSCSPAEPESSSPASTVATVSNENVGTVIEQLERDWITAILKKDAAALDRLLADDFNGTSPSAHTYPKELAIQELQNDTYVVESMNLDEVSVNAYGDTAVAFTSQEEKSRYLDTDISGHYHYTNVWIKRNGTWQVVASHGSRFLDKH